MSIPASSTSAANKIARQNSAGKLDNSLGGSANTVATLGADALVPAVQAPAKAVYATGGAQALAAADVGAISSGAGSVTGAQLSAGAKQAALESKLTGAWVQTAEQASPGATSLNVKVLLGFDTLAGVDPEGSVKGKGALLEAAGGAEFNTTTGKVGGGAKASSSKCVLTDANGNGIVDAAGAEVWAVVTCSARTTAGTYTLRFFSGEFASGAEVAYNMGQAFKFIYGQIFDLNDMPKWSDSSVALIDKEAAQLAPGQIGTNELGAGSVTQAKMANDSVGSAQIIDGNVGTAELAAGAVTQAKLANDSVGSAQIIDGAVGTAEVADAAITAAKTAATIALLDGSRAFTAAIKTKGRKLEVRALAATGAIATTDDHVRLDGTGAAVDGQLPAATGSGMSFSAIAINLTNACRIVPNGTDTINGVNAAESFLVVRESRIFIDAAAGQWDMIG